MLLMLVAGAEVAAPNAAAKLLREASISRIAWSSRDVPLRSNKISPETRRDKRRVSRAPKLVPLGVATEVVRTESNETICGEPALAAAVLNRFVPSPKNQDD